MRYHLEISSKGKKELLGPYPTAQALLNFVFSAGERGVLRDETGRQIGWRDAAVWRSGIEAYPELLLIPLLDGEPITPDELRQSAEQGRKGALKAADDLFRKAFTGPRDPRSEAYKLGVRAALLYRFAGESIAKSRPYTAGTAEFDAFGAGVDEGHGIYRQWVVEAAG